VSLAAHSRRGHETSEYSVAITVRGATAPVRVYLYLDGDLIESWTPAPEICHLAAPISAGRHALTARAIDVNGRWGGASTILASSR
jgi:hypothetical protein